MDVTIGDALMLAMVVASAYVILIAGLLILVAGGVWKAVERWTRS